MSFRARGFFMDDCLNTYALKMGTDGCDMYVNGDNVARWSPHDLDYLDQFIATLQEARAVLAGEAGEQPKRAMPDEEQATASHAPHLAGIRRHPWPDEAASASVSPDPDLSPTQVAPER